MLKIRSRWWSLQRWPASYAPANEHLPNIFQSEEDERSVTTIIARRVDQILAEEKPIPRSAPGDLRRALKVAIPVAGPRLKAVARRLVTPSVVREAIRIASGRAPTRSEDRQGITAGILAAMVVTLTRFVHRFRPDIAPPACAPANAKNRHARRKHSATAVKPAPVRSPKPAADRLAGIKRPPIARKG